MQVNIRVIVRHRLLGTLRLSLAEQQTDCVSVGDLSSNILPVMVTLWTPNVRKLSFPVSSTGVLFPLGLHPRVMVQRAGPATIMLVLGTVVTTCCRDTLCRNRWTCRPILGPFLRLPRLLCILRPATSSPPRFLYSRIGILMVVTTTKL